MFYDMVLVSIILSISFQLQIRDRYQLLPWVSSGRDSAVRRRLVVHTLEIRFLVK